VIKRLKTLRVTPEVALDQRLSNTAFRAFVVMLICRDGKTGRSSITIERLAKHLGLGGKKNALKAVQQLTQYGYVRNLARQRATGCYEFLAGVENVATGQAATPLSLEQSLAEWEESRQGAAPVIEGLRKRFGRVQDVPV